MPKSVLSAVVQEYEVFLRVERNLAPRTIREYLDDLKDMAGFLAKRIGTAEIQVCEIKKPHLKSFLEHLQGDRQFSSLALARILSSMRGLFRFCLDQEHITSNPIESFRSPKHPRKLPVYLVESELRKLFASPDQATPLGRRDHTILVLLANTGFRVSELAGLQMGSVSFERGAIRVLGKGRKERLVPMNAAVRAGLERWLAVRPVCDTPALFVNLHGKPLGVRGVQVLLAKHGIKANIPRERLTPHKLRHTFATLLHMNEVDIIEIQALLGHANISSTQIYTHTNSGRLRSAVDTLTDLPM